jgi:hypothetical protein
MKYLAREGKVFDNECDCIAYENELNSSDIQRQNDLVELTDLKNAYLEAKEKYDNALEKFNKKYRPDTCSIDDLLKYLFG